MKEIAPFWLACLIIFGQTIFCVICLYLATDGFDTKFWKNFWE